ncbi:hypothetical protein [Breoghania sp.]|uniref:hypothetical protein n=1 Tax=Breoghania sp. TaxID=2065378 RepID=UPI002AA8DFFA|nr:hypothetical protein [Breoghania sp.]
MSAEMQSGDFARASVQAVHSNLSWATLREALGRPDLDDDVLGEAVSDAIETIVRPSCDEDRARLIGQLVAGDLDGQLPRVVVASLCLPAPRAPLAMPVQVLQSERRPVFARFFSRIRARQG